jgi:hypothetical protein
LLRNAEGKKGTNKAIRTSRAEEEEEEEPFEAKGREMSTIRGGGGVNCQRSLGLQMQKIESYVQVAKNLKK